MLWEEEMHSMPVLENEGSTAKNNSSSHDFAQDVGEVRGPGLVQVYTGNGKGKTTAALGLALRAAGHGYRVYILQFLKGGGYTGELSSLMNGLGELIRIEQFGTGCINTTKQARITAFNGTSKCPKNYVMERDVMDCKECRYCFLIHDDDYINSRRAINKAKLLASSGSYDVIILDEVTHAINKRLVSVDDVIEIIKNKRKSVEIVITGRDAPKEILDMADLVTEMREVKHPWTKGVKARKGIEY